MEEVFNAEYVSLHVRVTNRVRSGIENCWMCCAAYKEAINSTFHYLAHHASQVAFHMYTKSLKYE